MVLDIKESNFGNQQCLRFHIWFTMALYYKMRQALLQSATKVYYKMVQSLQNASILLQSATFITKCIGTRIKNTILTNKKLFQEAI